ncbi:Citrate transporter [Musa troglodytarum]|uniref:Citrate transporter n=1 Tax=Musa troglodytarum TaxID=320322 RepID=A0A9E7E7P5_9LILI|nr:Citrate transporter [Musa troglodytarum]
MALSSFLIGNGILLTQSLVKPRNFDSSSSAAAAAAVSSSAPLFAALPRRPLLLGPLLGSQRWRRASGIARAEEKAKSSSSSSSPSSPLLPGKDCGDYRELIDGSGNCDPLCSVDEVSSQDFEASYQPKTDLLKALTILATALAGAAAINHSWVAANQAPSTEIAVSELTHASAEVSEIVFFLLGAMTIAPSTEIAVSELTHASAEVSEIVFFLLGAMTIVEIIDAHQGFKLVTDNITTRKPRILLWVVGLVTFFLSSVLDNLTSTIVMVSLLRKLVPPSEYRKFLGAVVVIAANAGGAWTPIGDVTTTMLWINGQISTLQTMQDLFIPSALSLAVPLALMSLTSEVNGTSEKQSIVLASEQMAPRGQLVFAVGIGALLFVPVFKAITGLPPYMGMLLGLGVLWILTDAIHFGDSGRQKLKVPQALSRIDTQGILFFLGILLSVSSSVTSCIPKTLANACLEAAGVLRELANYLDAHIPSVELIASAIGVVSAIIDNVPLVAATMGMYNLTSFPQDSEFWQLVAFCAGTGGSMLIIGSASGVAFMGMEKVDFFWYLRKVSGFAFAGYTAGIVAYLAAHNLPFSLPTSLAELPFLSGP